MFIALLLVLASTEDIATARAAKLEQKFTWSTYSPASFARAKAEHKVVLLDGAAEWCHWCHVMDETTYRDPEVGAWLAAHAIAIRVDIDERPDFAERYGDWGWPATILLTAEGEELGKFRGYLSPERMREIISTLDAARPMEAAVEAPPVQVSALSKSKQHAVLMLENFYDPKLGGWGLKRKVPIGMNVSWELALGTKASIARADFTLTQQRALIDPVWGGIYQYSVNGTWKEPHFEKLLAYQAANLEAYARGFEVTKKPAHRDAARALVTYVTNVLRSKDGTFLVNQDADVNAHDRTKPFMEGAAFYALSDAERRKAGSPWVDTHVYASENGKMIRALAGLPESVPMAVGAADQLITSHVLADGTVKHEATSSEKGPFFLEDAAAFGLALVRLGEVTKNAKYTALASKIADQLITHFADPKSGAFFESTVDPDAIGVFARRGHAFAPNVTAARLLAATTHQQRGREVLAALGDSKRLDAEYAWLGDYLLACRELNIE